MNKKKLILLILTLIFLTIFVLSVYKLYSIWSVGRFDAQKYKISSTVSDQTLSGEQVELPDNPINFAALKEQNADVYAWICLPGTKIDYPILQSSLEDNDFYLQHDMNKQKSKAGAIYTQRQNSKDFSDPNTVIYGHNMANGTMFRALHKFKDAEFFAENRYFYIYTEGSIYTYEIFAAYRYDDRHILNSFDFSKREIFEEYLNDILLQKANANIKTDIKLNSDSKIVTLSTCYANSKPEYRYIVQGVLVKQEQTK